MRNRGRTTIVLVGEVTIYESAFGR